jgi:hypothetical protein
LKNEESIFAIDNNLWNSSTVVSGGTLTIKHLIDACNLMLYGHLSPEERKKAIRRDRDKIYRRSKPGLVRRCWHKMKQRISGKNTLNPHLYAGKELLPVDTFIEWARDSKDLDRLHDQWVKSGYDIRYTPSVDRINSNIGYVLENIRWVTHQENSRMAMIKRYSK